MYTVYKDGELLDDDAKIYILDYGNDDDALVVMNSYAEYVTDPELKDALFDELGPLLLERGLDDLVYTVINRDKFKEVVKGILGEQGKLKATKYHALLYVALQNGEFHD